MFAWNSFSFKIYSNEFYLMLDHLSVWWFILFSVLAHSSQQNLVMEHKYCFRKRISWEFHEWRTRIPILFGRRHHLCSLGLICVFGMNDISYFWFYAEIDIFGTIRREFRNHFEFSFFIIPGKISLNRNWKFKFVAYRRIVHNADLFREYIFIPPNVFSRKVNEFQLWNSNLRILRSYLRESYHSRKHLQI